MSILTFDLVHSLIQSLENNPRYYEEPEKFKPSRWYHDSKTLELFTAFGVGSYLSNDEFDTCLLTDIPSIGPRICIGKKFATTEAVCFLSLLLREWNIKPLLRPQETIESWSDRVFRANLGMTLGITDVPIRLVRRNMAD